MFDWVNLLGKVVYYDHCLLYVKVILHDDTKTYFLAYIAIQWADNGLKNGLSCKFSAKKFLATFTMDVLLLCDVYETSTFFQITGSDDIVS